MQDREGLLAEFARCTGIVLQREQVARLDIYIQLLREYNQKVKLTAITEEEEIWRKHVLDSLLIFSALEIPVDARLVDVGTGAGIPGLLLKIYRSDLQVVLVESQRKKVTFLEEVVAKLDLQGIKCLWCRAEELGRQEGYRENFDLAVARALAGMNTLVEYCLPLVKVGGSMVAYKGPGGDEELKAASKAISILGGKIGAIWRGNLPGGLEERMLITIEKANPTPAIYPRRPGIPAKRPLI